MFGKIVLLYFCVFLLNFVHSRRGLVGVFNWLNYSEAEAQCSSNGSISEFPRRAYYIDCLDKQYGRIQINCNTENGTLEKEDCLDEQLTTDLAIYKVKNLKQIDAIRWFNKNPREIRQPVEVHFFADTFYALLLSDFTEYVDVMSEALANLLSLDWLLFEVMAPAAWFSLLLDLDTIIARRDEKKYSKIDLTKISNLTLYDININRLEENLLLLSNGNVSVVRKDWDLNRLDFEIAVRIPADAKKSINSKVTLAVINKPRDNLISPIFKIFEAFQKPFDYSYSRSYFKNVKNDGSNYGCLVNGVHTLITNYIPGEIITNGLSTVYSCNFSSIYWLAVGLQESKKLECPQETVNNLTFAKTEAGVVATTQEFCLQQNHFPVVRKCSENGTWEKPSGKCSSSNDAETSNTTLELYKASNPESKEGLQILHNISKEPQHLSPVDVIYAAKILENSKNDLQLSVEVINNLMEIPKEILNETQQILNSTDRIIGSLDKLFTNYYFRHVNVSLSNILVKTVKNFTGVIVQNGKINYFEDTSFLDSEEFDVAFVMKDPRLLHLLWFKNDHLFNSVQEKLSGSSILNILQQFPQEIDVTIYFKRTECTLEQSPECSFWKYGHDATNKPIQGRWKTDGKSQFFKPNYYSCRFNHTTHFGLLLSDDLKENFILDVITIVGYALSFVGFLVILTTAVTFKRWCQHPNHKILLNVSFCLFLLISTFFLSSRVPAGYYCIMTGMLLHYLCLSYFLWTSVISIKAHHDFVTVLPIRSQSLSKKFYLCWGSPFIIVVATAFTSFQSYDKICDYSNQLCYPKGQYLKYFVILPIGIILACNIVIYSMIIVSITKKVDIRSNRVTNSCAVQKKSSLLFSMMGLTWIFGVVGIFIEMFLYVFCLLATLQGFIMMIFYIFDAKRTRTLWKDTIVSSSRNEN